MVCVFSRLLSPSLLPLKKAEIARYTVSSRAMCRSGRSSCRLRHPALSAGSSHSAGPRGRSITCGSVASETSLSMISEHGRTRRSTPLCSTGRCTVGLGPPPCSCGTGRCTADLRGKKGNESGNDGEERSDLQTSHLVGRTYLG